MQHFTIILHTSSGPRVGMPVSVDALPDALHDAGFVLGADERLEVIPFVDREGLIVAGTPSRVATSAWCGDNECGEPGHVC